MRPDLTGTSTLWWLIGFRRVRHLAEVSAFIRFSASA
jgi:hypothetical protein